ncbi:hypothetical protein ACNKU7_01005 [Microbulbifer sp. SA54]|uniref:hypothetical protein n=1 Tax=Microbulbifer sp. SA54 TaxID=3401577 RepID=UPI003AAC0CCD
MLHRLHRISALLIGCYVAGHIANHMLALLGVDAHIAYMEQYRHIYRAPVIEPVLLTCVLFQVASGLVFIARRWGKRRGFFDHVQAISGGYLAFFLLFHVGAVLYGRTVQGVDTNFYFAAAGLHLGYFPLFFMPYYTLAVAAFFSHVACGLRWLLRSHLSQRLRDRLAIAVMLLGLLLGLVIVAAFAGAFYAVEIPSAYCFSDC